MKVILNISLKILILFFIIQGICYGIKVFYPINKHTNIPQELGYNYINKILNDPTDPTFHNQILNIGDSSAATAIHTRKLGNEVMSLGVWGSSPAELYYYLHKYLLKYQAPKCILLTHILSADYYKDHSFWELIVPYSNISINEYSELYDKSKSYNEFPGNSENKLTFMFKIITTKWHLFFATPSIYYEKLKYRNKDIDIINKIAKSFEVTRGEYLRFVQGAEVKGEWWNFFSHPMPKSQYYDYYFKLIIEEATSRKIKLYTITPPFSNKLKTLYPQRLTQLINYYQNKSNQNQNFIHLDLNSNFPADHFIDDAHLNYYGAIKFTNKLSNFLDCQ